MNDPRNQKPSDKGVGSTGGSACSTRERKWRIRISDCYCEYEYEMDARVDDVCIHDLYELVRERLKADDVYGRFVDPVSIRAPSGEDATRNKGPRRFSEPARCENCGKPAVRLTEDGINLCRECYALCPEDTPNTQG